MTSRDNATCTLSVHLDLSFDQVIRNIIESTEIHFRSCVLDPNTKVVMASMGGGAESRARSDHYDSEPMPRDNRVPGL